MVMEVCIKKVYQDFTLDVSWSSPNQVTAVFGPSGSGKSLTLLSIAGLVRPDDGVIVSGGKVFFDKARGVDLSPQRRRIGLLFQESALFPHMSVFENVAYGVERDKRKSGRVEELLHMLKIEHLASKRPHQLSGGERQRVALARALAITPDLLLLDEPFSALHLGLKEHLFQELENIAEVFDVPVVLVSHNLDEVFRFAQYMVLYQEGRVIQEGSPSNVYNHPINIQAAKIMGHRNFLKVTVEAIIEDRILKVRLPNGQKLRGIDASNGRLRIGDKGVAMIHPLAISPTKNLRSFKFSCQLADMVDRGDFTVLRFNLESTLELKIQKSLMPNFILEPGREARLQLSTDSVRIFEGKIA